MLPIFVKISEVTFKLPTDFQVVQNKTINNRKSLLFALRNHGVANQNSNLKMINRCYREQNKWYICSRNYSCPFRRIPAKKNKYPADL